MLGNINFNNGIIESGSNNYGNYIKYESGMMICTKLIPIENLDINTPWGSMYSAVVERNLNFAKTFTALPTVCGTYSASNQLVAMVGEITYNMSKITRYTLARATETTYKLNGYLSVIAIGKWK